MLQKLLLSSFLGAALLLGNSSVQAMDDEKPQTILVRPTFAPEWPSGYYEIGESSRILRDFPGTLEFKNNGKILVIFMTGTLDGKDMELDVVYKAGNTLFYPTPESNMAQNCDAAGKIFTGKKDLTCWGHRSYTFSDSLNGFMFSILPCEYLSQKSK